MMEILVAAVCVLGIFAVIICMNSSNITQEEELTIDEEKIADAAI